MRNRDWYILLARVDKMIDEFKMTDIKITPPNYQEFLKRHHYDSTVKRIPYKGAWITESTS